MLQVAQEELDSKMKREYYPYTQNHYLFDIIKKKRDQTIKNNLLMTIKGIETVVSHGVSPISKVPHLDPQACYALINAAFDAREHKSIESHLAEEMHVILESYAKVAVKRIIDDVPMICLNLSKLIYAQLEKSLNSVTDAELSEHMMEEESFTFKHNQATKQLQMMEKAQKAFRGLRGGEGPAKAARRS
jgi:hypothetical protein